MTFGPVVPSHGPSPARIVLLAEAPGTEESAQLRPLVGPSGWELKRMLSTIGIDINDCRKINVFSRQPDGNNLSLYGTNAPSDWSQSFGPLSTNPICYVHDMHRVEITRVYEELSACSPNIVIALGNTACWVLNLGLGISALRGSVHTTTIPGLPRPLKVLPTYHPAAVLRQWDLRVVALADLEKANVESQSPLFTFDNTHLWINPTLEDLVVFDHEHMERATICAADIETKRGQITCISFAPSTGHSLVIPFWQEGPDPNYWASPSVEAQAWSFVRKWMEREDLTKVFQNGLYDLAYLQAYCTPRACSEDTMLLHHSLFSELQKGLGFLGSIYANTPSWKKMRTAKREEILKRDD